MTLSIMTVIIDDIICDTQHKDTLQSWHNNHQQGRLDFLTIRIMSIRICIITISIEDIICNTQHKATLQSLHNNHQHSRLDFVTIVIMTLSIMKVSMKGLDCDNQQNCYSISNFFMQSLVALVM